MATGKTGTLTIRFEPGLKDALRTAAKREHYSIADMMEVVIRDYLRARWRHDPGAAGAVSRRGL
jgi:hypothetical protein